MGSAAAAGCFPWNGIAFEAIPDAVPTQVQRWRQKFQEKHEGASAYRMRCVGSMQPTNLAPTQPKGCRNKAREQRKRCQETKEIPVVPRPLRPPCDMGLAVTLAKLQESDVPGIAEVQQVVHASFIDAK